ncbi:MAG: hypothetical protein IK080_03395 [Clostridia bacterium]|nr:hypothetical protein [Clostridia bacterium]
MKRERVSAVMRQALDAFRRQKYRTGGTASAVWLTDNYYLLVQTARRALQDCRCRERISADPALLPDLFSHCRRCCADGRLPEEPALAAAFAQGLSAVQAELLPLALTCALLAAAAQGVRLQSDAGGQLVGNAVRGLQKLEELDFSALAQTLSRSEAVLRQDPAGVYPMLDASTAADYRRAVARLAARRGVSEEAAAQAALASAQTTGGHIGEALFARRRTHRQGRLCLLMELLLPTAAAFAVGVLSGQPRLGWLLLIPFIAMLHDPVDAAFLQQRRPRRLPRLDRSCRLVSETDALVTVSVLLPAPAQLPRLETHLEQLYLSCCTGQIRLCCLADLRQAPAPQLPEDPAVLAAAQAMIARLNRKYGGGFLLAVRERSYSKTQRVFAGKERKRGAVTALVNAIYGDETGFLLLEGDRARLRQVRFLIALDADTQPQFDAVRDLLAVALHPRHRPVVDPKKGRVTAGYGILVPQLTQRIDPQNSLYARIMTGDAGTAAYDAVSAEKYQDLFEESLFCGKGLIDVAAYRQVIRCLPEERILSHDSLESGLLRAGFCPSVSMSEQYPQSERADFRRLDRWIRGDWQNARFIFGGLPLGALTRFRLLENLWRSLLPALCLAVSAAGLRVGGAAGALLAAAGAIGFAAPDLFAALYALAHGGFSALSRLFYSQTLPAALHAMLAAGVRLMLWPRYALTGVLAAGRALWRQAVSKRNLLAWTTAAGSEGAGSVGVRVLRCWPSVVTGTVFLLFGGAVHRLLGVLLLCAVPFVLLSGRRARAAKRTLSAAAQERLLGYAAAEWRYFDALCTEEHHYLPPDNLQLSPVRATAARTSPTNIGLMLASVLAARDFGFLDSRTLWERLDRSLSSVERLETYHGNLYNWYATRDLSVLDPFVSTVDSGNFLCCLTALREGLRDYVGEYPPLEGLIARIGSLLDRTQLRVLYRSRRRLFSIGCYPDRAEETGCYDLFMSEARMTAYYAVAKRLVPREHWGALGRIAVGQGRYSGLVSWTGTMFEYFMPALFLPAPRGSLTYESLQFCLYCQRRYAGKRPYGASESGYYAFDGQLNYQYKAHGVQRLGLKRGLDQETVVAPYASFLTLSAAPGAALRNLRRLERMGMLGEYGFYEAADFTPARCGGAPYKIVRSFMAHHVGMSLLALDNVLFDDRMQRRFLRDGAMRGAQSLLEERIPKGTVPFHDLHGRVPKTGRGRPILRSDRVAAPALLQPMATALSNGRLTVCITESGTGISMLDGIDLHVRSSDPRTVPQGVFAVASSPEGRIPFVRAIDRGSGAEFRCVFAAGRVEHRARAGRLRLRMLTQVLQQQNCELRTFTLENTGGAPWEGTLTVYLEPCLTTAARHAAHPAFSKLFVTDVVLPERQCAVFARTDAREGTAAALAVGFLDAAPVTCVTARSQVLTAPLGAESLGLKPLTAGERGNPDACCALAVPVRLAGHGRRELRLCLAAAETPQTALHTLLSVRACGGAGKRARTVFGSDAMETAVGMRLLQAALDPLSPSVGLPLDAQAQMTRADLWSFGVSGDYPIVLVQLERTDAVSMLLPYVRGNQALRTAGVTTDLVIAFAFREGYAGEITAAVRALLRAESCAPLLGVNGGVHLAPLARHTPQECAALAAAAAVTFRARVSAADSLHPAPAFLPLHRLPPPETTDETGKGYSFTAERITLRRGAANNPKTLDIPWHMVYANAQFGTLVSDRAIGFTWAINAQENPLTQRTGDPAVAGQGELLLLRLGDEFYDLAACGAATFTPAAAQWQGEAAGISYTATVEIAAVGMVKRCSVSLHNRLPQTVRAALSYQIRPVGMPQRLPAGAFRGRKLPSGLLAQAVMAPFPGWTALQCDGEAAVSFSSAAFFAGQPDPAQIVPKDGMAAVTRTLLLQPGGKADCTFWLSWGAAASAAEKLPAVARFGAPEIAPLEIGHPAPDRFASRFLYHQVRAARFFGRVGPQQCAGAFGFRDQLQDCLALVLREPVLVRRHLLRCAAVQFADGDVLHWWHVLPGGRIAGVRTRCSDDLLWLAYVLADYLQQTGDYGILDVPLPYLSAEPLLPDERERYLQPVRTQRRETLLAHCLRAADRAMTAGPHGLPLIGSCDWNDGFSAVGTAQAGESVWLAMFQICVFRRMAEICAHCGLQDRKRALLQRCRALTEAVEATAWMGDHYARAFLPDGQPLGGAGFLDLLPQAWAVFAGLGRNGRAETALETAWERLYDPESGLVRLLEPPFATSDRDRIGYIAAYPPGLRENGGQYTHAAVWFATALLESGKTAKGLALLEALSPEVHAARPGYGGEPYAMAADLAAGQGIEGRAGWTHYTGSAAWYARCLSDHRALIRKYADQRQKNGHFM